MSKILQLPPDWKKFLNPYVQENDITTLFENVAKEYEQSMVFPELKNIFSALQAVSPKDVHVVILGQDPYHGIGQAHGYSFSVKEGSKLPPSLKNIFKEIENDCGIQKDFKNGNLENLAKQGVLLLNSVLTVRSGIPLSHKNIGWETLTDAILSAISLENDHVVFMLWGNYAKK